MRIITSTDAGKILIKRTKPQQTENKSRESQSIAKTPKWTQSSWKAVSQAWEWQVACKTILEVTSKETITFWPVMSRKSVLKMIFCTHKTECLFTHMNAQKTNSNNLFSTKKTLTGRKSHLSQGTTTFCSHSLMKMVESSSKDSRFTLTVKTEFMIETKIS